MRRKVNPLPERATRENMIRRARAFHHEKR
jgi:hypothetical protein